MNINIRKAGLLLLATGAVSLVGCGNINSRVSIEVKEDIVEEVDTEEDLDVIIEESNSDWKVYDSDSGLYKVDVDKMFKEYFHIELLDEIYINDAKAYISDVLGDDIYTSDIDNDGVSLLNLNGEKIKVDYSDEYNSVSISNKISDTEDIYVSFNQYHSDYDRIQDSDFLNLNKVYIIRRNNKEVIRGIVFRRDDKLLLAMSYCNNRLNISSDYGEAHIKINKDEYQEFVNVTDKYVRDDDIINFVIDERIYIDKYLEEIKEEDSNFYYELSNNINILSSEKEHVKSR